MFCTVADVKRYATNLPQTAGADELLRDLIASEQSLIEQYVECRLESATYTETLDGNNVTLLPVNNWPITAVSSVTVDGVAWTFAPAGSAQVGYRFNKRSLIAVGQRWPEDHQNVVVTYTAGFAPGSPEMSTAKQACIELVVYRFNERSRQGVASKSISGETVTYRESDIPVAIKARLNDFRSWV